MILGGLVAIWLFMRHVRRLDAAGREPLVTPSLFANRQMTGGLVMFFFQFVVMMGLFFVIPLYLSVALGLSAIDTGIKITPLSRRDAARRRRHPEVLPVGLAAPGGRGLARGGGGRHRGAVQRDGCRRERRDRHGALDPDRPRDGRPRVAARERHRLGRVRRARARRSAACRTPRRSSGRRSARRSPARCSSPRSRPRS